MKKKLTTDLFFITLGALVFSAGVGLFLSPNNLAPGGVTGVAIILNNFTGLQTGTWSLILNIPLLLFGLWRFGFRFIGKTMYAVFAISQFTNLFCSYEPVTREPILACLAGAGLMGVGAGLVFRTGTTTGGIDILVKALRQHFRHLKTGFIFQCFDISIVTLSGIVFRNIELALYALLAALICGRVINQVLYGSDEARLIYIITDRPEEIRKALLEKVDVGCTLVDCQGGYSGLDKQLILSTVHNRMAPLVRETVRSIDPHAFMILGVAEEVYGLGYKDYFSENL